MGSLIVTGDFYIHIIAVNPPHAISHDLKARIPVLFYKQGLNLHQISVLSGVKKSMAYKSLQYFRAYGVAHNPHTHKTGRNQILSLTDIEFIAALVDQRHCIYLDEIRQAHSENQCCNVTLNLNPIEQAFFSIKSYLRRHWNDISLSVIDAACHNVTAVMVWGFIQSSGYTA